MTTPDEFPGGDDQLRHIEEIINTLGGEVTGGQDDLDRVMPDNLGEDMPDTLRNSDYEGVPVPYMFQFIVAAGGWIDRLHAEGSTPELIAEVTTGLSIREGRYPDAPGWARTRAQLAEEFQAAGDLDAALGMVCGMRSKHAMARAAMKLTERLPEGSDSSVVLTAIADRLGAEPGSSDHVAFLQAVIDETLRDNPSDPSLDSLESTIRTHNPDYDPVHSWAESMATHIEEVDWSGVARVITHDQTWPEGASIRFRQSVMTLHFEMRKLLDDIGPLSEHEVEDLLLDVDGLETDTDPAPIWDQFRFAYGSHCLDTGQPEYTRRFGRAMRNTSAQQSLIEKMIVYGAEDDAWQLAQEMTDARVMAETLLYGDWPDDRGIKRLAAIIEDESYPLGRRIECLSVVRDKMLGAGKADKAAQYEARLSELRRRLASEN